jgi:hypothetical protein
MASLAGCTRKPAALDRDAAHDSGPDAAPDRPEDTAQDAWAVIDGTADAAIDADGALDGGAGDCPPHPLEITGCSCGSRWLRTVNEGNEDLVGGVTADSDGNVILVGSTRRTTPFDIWARKYDASGLELWTQKYESSASDIANGVAADQAGNVWVTGSTGGQAWVRKYDPTGAEQWTLSPGAADASSTSDRKAVAIDNDGNGLLTGPAVGATKYSPTGLELWTRPADPGSLAQNFTTGIAVDRAGNVVVVGSVRADDGPIGVENWRTDIWVRKFSPAGDEVWTRTYDGSRDDWASTVAVDPDNNVLVVGRSYLTTATGSLAYLGWLRKYSPAGEVLWTRTEENAGPREIGNQIAIAPSGRIFVAWLHISEYDGQGALQRTRDCRADRLAFDRQGRALLSGSVGRPNPSSFITLADVWVGSFLW